MACLLMVIPPENFRDEELFETRVILEWAGHRTVLASTVTGLCPGSCGGAAKAELLLEQARAEDYDGVIFIGGSGVRSLFWNPQALALAAAMHKRAKMVAAICLAPVILANAGVLNGRRATVSSSESATIEARGAIYAGPGVVVDGNVVTGDGPKVCEKFAQSIDSLLRQRRAA
ncbi:MAG: DJ-1/PfpI family protein [Terracidiphilus sp.]|nr:DJ-1/PfpI family protein [Terracidiphilus sp.]